jgi:uncharacterized BrkB/YihY/UPF0761 family membrane protein
MLKLLLNLRILGFLLRFLLAPTVALVVGFLVFLSIIVILYTLALFKTLELLSSSPLLASMLLVLELFICVVAVFILRLLYVRLKERWKLLRS